MRCNEAIKLLTDKRERSNPDLAIHLEECAECQERANAAGLLDSMLEAARGELPVVELRAVQRAVQSRADRQSGWEIIMSKVISRSHEHRRLVTGVGFALVVFLLVTLVPFSYNAITGYRITLAGEPRTEISTGLLDAALEAVGLEGIDVGEGEVPGQYIFTGLANEQEAQNIAAALARLAGSDQVPAVEPIEGRLSGTIYAQAARKITSDDGQGPVRIRLEDGRFVLSDSSLRKALLSTGTSEAEVEAVIRDYIVDRGGKVSDLIISAEVDEDRLVKLIRLKADADSDLPEQDFQVRMLRGEAALRYRVNSDSNASEGLLEILSEDDLDSLSGALDRGIILELPDGSEVGEEAVMIRLHVMPRPKSETKK